MKTCNVLSYKYFYLCILNTYKQMNDIIVKPKNKAQKEALKEVLKKMEIEFEDVQKEIYNPEFVHDVIIAKEEVEAGKYVVIDVDNL